MDGLSVLGGETINTHLACMAPGGRHIGLSFMSGIAAPVDLRLARKGMQIESAVVTPA